MNKEQWSEIEFFILNVLSATTYKLDEESIKYVKHYLYHNEFEMAFEGLFIEIMKFNAKPAIDMVKSKEIGLLLNLHKESVFDSEFWMKFINYIDN